MNKKDILHKICNSEFHDINGCIWKVQDSEVDTVIKCIKCKICKQHFSVYKSELVIIFEEYIWFNTKINIRRYISSMKNYIYAMSILYKVYCYDY